MKKIALLMAACAIAASSAMAQSFFDPKSSKKETQKTQESLKAPDYKKEGQKTVTVINDCCKNNEPCCNPPQPCCNPVQQEVCPEGNVCPEGKACPEAQQVCPEGKACPEAQQVCPEGKACPEAQQVCPEGKACPEAQQAHECQGEGECANK